MAVGNNYENRNGNGEKKASKPKRKTHQERIRDLAFSRLDNGVWKGLSEREPDRSWAQARLQAEMEAIELYGLLPEQKPREPDSQPPPRQSTPQEREETQVAMSTRRVRKRRHRES